MTFTPTGDLADLDLPAPAPSEPAPERRRRRGKPVNEPSDTPPKKPTGGFKITIVGKRLRADEIAETLEDLAALLDAGESEELALLQLAEHYQKTNVGAAYQRAADGMRTEGFTFVEALVREEDVLPRVARELIAAATTTRALSQNLRQAALIIVEGSDIKARIRASLFGPMTTLSLVIAFIFVAAEWLLPGVADMFRSIGSETPPMTLFMVAVGASLKWVMLGLVGAGVLWLVFWGLAGRKVKALRVRRDTLAVTMPLSGPIMQMSMSARFVDVLAACLGSGMSELDSLDIASRASGNEAVEKHVTEHIELQREGEATFTDFASSKLFPWNMKARLDLSPSPQQTITVLTDLGQVFHKKANRRMNAFADRVGKFTELGVLAIAACVILIVALPVLTFVPTLMQGVQ